MMDIDRERREVKSEKKDNEEAQTLHFWVLPLLRSKGLETKSGICFIPRSSLSFISHLESGFMIEENSFEDRRHLIWGEENGTLTCRRFERISILRQ